MVGKFSIKNIYLHRMNKYAVVTGGSRGIGRAIALKFAAAGWKLGIVSRSQEKLDAIKAEIIAIPDAPEPLCYSADLSKKEEVLGFSAACLEIGTPDILINNAGVFVMGQILNEEAGDLEKQIETNLYSAYHLTRALLPKMIEKKSGHVFNMCSIASLQAYTSGSSYTISKFALLGFSKALREELKPHNVKVTSIMPGAVMSDSWAGSDIDPDRIMKAEDIADMVYAMSQLAPQTVVEDIVLRPQLGDL